MTKTAGIIIIGNEVLSGKTQDINSTFLCRELRSLGVDVRRITVIPDEIDLIGQTAAAFSADWDYVFTTGGVGPTHDDVTIEGVAKGFGVKAVVHPDLEKRLRDRYGSELNTARLRMALAPRDSELLGQGSVFSPVIRYRNIYILPGVPRILQERFTAIRELFRGEPFFLKNIYVSEGEGTIAKTLNDLLEKFPDVLLGSYPALDNPDFKVKVTVESKDRDYLTRAAEWLLEKLPTGRIVRVESIDPTLC
jgi:molybdenum cofactor synthesis domain-containing protein